MVPKGTVNAVGVEDCRQFFDHAPIPVQCLAPDGTVLHANQALLDLLGYAHADYVGLHVSEVHALDLGGLGLGGLGLGRLRSGGFLLRRLKRRNDDLSAPLGPSLGAGAAHVD